MASKVNIQTLRDEMGEPETWSVPQAGWKLFGAGRNKSYELAKQGIIPTIQVGGQFRVPIAAARTKVESAS